MPIYEYRCSSCRGITEAIQRMDEAPLQECPSCAGPLVRIVSKTSFILKGEGWYKDGYSYGKAASESGKKVTPEKVDTVKTAKEPERADAA